VTIGGLRNGCHSSVDLPGLCDVSPQPPELVKHLAVALSRHVRDLRQAGRAVPSDVDELTTFLARTVRTRPHATPVDDEGDAGHSPGVADRLLVTKGEAAGRLGVSVRTVERLVAAGRLPLVHVERAARFRVTDLEAFVHDLSEEQATECDTDPPWPG
jgi:excisionase family DNA binding protein